MKLPTKIAELYSHLLVPSLEGSRWSEADEQRLMQLYKSSKETLFPMKGKISRAQEKKIFEGIAKRFDNRSAEECDRRYRDMRKAAYNMEAFSEEEQQRLKTIVLRLRRSSPPSPSISSASASTSASASASAPPIGFSWTDVSKQFNIESRKNLRKDIKVAYRKRSARQCLEAVVKHDLLQEELLQEGSRMKDHLSIPLKEGFAKLEPDRVLYLNRWSDQEKGRLRTGCEVFVDNYKEIAEVVKTRDAEGCQWKWDKLENDEAMVSKGKRWSEEEKEQLDRAVECYEDCDPLPWNLIAQHIADRTPTQCRERYLLNQSKQTP